MNNGAICSLTQEVRFPAQDALWVDVSLQPALPRTPQASGVGPEGWFAYNLLNSLFDQTDEALAWVDQQQMLVTCIGDELFVIGVIVGIGEDLISSIEALLSLVRELVLVEFYRHLIRYDRGGDFGALVSPIGFMVDRMGFRSVVTEAYHDLVDLIEFCGEVLSDPSIMMDAITKQAKSEYDTFIRLWNEPTLSSRFEAGRIFATVVLVVIDLVFFVKGAVKVSAKLPNMLRGFKKVSAKQWRALKPKANTARDVGGEVGEGSQRGVEPSKGAGAVEGDVDAVVTTRDESVVLDNVKGLSSKVLDDFPNARKISAQEAINLSGRDNAGPNARHFKSWIEEGGEVFHDVSSDSFIYGKTMKTKTFGEDYVYVAYKPDVQNGGDRFPDFSKYIVERVELNKVVGGSKDFGPAWKQLEKQKGKAYISEMYGISANSKGKYKNTGVSPKVYTWHHNQNLQHMELLDWSVHDAFRHKGGTSLVGKRD